MKYEFNFLLTQTILITCVIGVVRWYTLDTAYRPFVYSCILDWITEVMVFILILNRIIPNAVSNSYILLTCILFIWQFKLWGFFYNRPWLFNALICLQILVWVIDHFFVNKIDEITSLYRIEYSFLMVVMAITFMNKLIIDVYGNILKDARFLICVGLVVFFTFNIFVEVFYLNSGTSLIYKQSVFDIKRYVNVFTNLLFALAMLWIPRKKNFMMPY